MTETTPPVAGDDYTKTLARAGAGAAAWMVATYAVARVIGLGGFRLGWLWCALLLGGGAVAVLLLAGRRLPGASSYVASAAVIGLVLGIQLHSVAPISRSRIGEYLDSLAIEGEVLDETASGNGRCSPECPTVTRRYRMIYNRAGVAMTTVEAKLVGAGFSVEDVRREGTTFVVDGDLGRVEGRFERSGAEPGAIGTVTFTSKRR